MKDRNELLTCLPDVHFHSTSIDSSAELFAFDDLCADTVTFGADQFLVGGMIFLEAGHALQFGGHAAEVQCGFFSNGVFGDDLPVELDRVIHHRGKFTHDDVQVGDAFGVCLFRVLQGYIKNDFELRLVHA